MTTCPNATAPIDISRNVDSYCNLKCDYSFQYPYTPVKIKHGGDHLELRFDKTNDPPVVYNANNYEVTVAHLYTPSLHTYTGERADAELLIVHNNINGKGTLIVSVPFMMDKQGRTTDTLRLLDRIVVQTANTANNKNQQTVLNDATFTLNKFVPVEPYYSYTGTLPYYPCNGGEVNYVVFSKDSQNQQTISSDALASLQQLLKRHKYATSPSNPGGLFFNRLGPKLIKGAATDDGLYIECQPTGSDGEVFIPNQQSSAQLFSGGSLKNLLRNGLFQTIIGVLLIIFIMKLGKILLKKLTDEDEPGTVTLKTAAKIGGMQLKVKG